MAIPPQMINELEEALKKERSFQRLWDTAAAWLTIAEQSQEFVDLQRSIELYRLASRKKEVHPPFLASFGEALLLFGSFLGDPAYVREGLEILRQAIQGKEICAWRSFAEGHKLLYDLTGNREDFEKADSTFQRAIIATPEQSQLWLQWGVMFLESGWRRRQLSEIEMALEKFTSLKMNDCPPALVTAYLGEGLALLGLFLDDLKLIHDGKEKVITILNQHEEFPELLVAMGMVQLIEGLYFQDAGHFTNAVDFFHKGLESNSRDLRCSHALFQAYLGWGVTMRDSGCLMDACDAIERLSSLRPSSSVHLIEWGTALLRLCQLEEDSLEQQAICEEAIDKFRKAVELNGDMEAEYQLGSTLDLLGDITGVEEYFEEAIEILTRLHCRLPGDLQVTFHLAMALSHHGEFTANVELLFEAVRTFEEVAGRDPEDEEAFCHLGYTQLLLSEHTYDANHPEKSQELRSQAEGSLMRALSLGSNETNYHLACLYSLSGLTEKSLDYLKRADVAKALPPEEDLQHDHWIENVRKTDAFVDFMEERKRHG